MTPTPDREATDADIADTMMQCGGSFVQQLGRLYQMADAVNREKLRAAFADYWEKYRQLAVLKAYAPRATTVAHSSLVAAAPVMLEALHSVWVLASTLDLGPHERSMLRDVIAPALEAADGRIPAVTP
jgi:hypothetical protein